MNRIVISVTHQKRAASVSKMVARGPSADGTGTGHSSDSNEDKTLVNTDASSSAEESITSDDDTEEKLSRDKDVLFAFGPDNSWFMRCGGRWTYVN